jgi:uncharacterized membrane protein
VRLAAPLATVVTDEIVIRRPRPDVYAFYRDFTNLPRFIGDVVAVRRLGPTAYRWVVAAPLGRHVRMNVTITEDDADRLLRYRTGGPPLLRGQWELSFAAEGDGEEQRTRVREQLVVPLGRAGRVALAAIGKFPDREVAANLRRLKEVLEIGDRPQ